MSDYNEIYEDVIPHTIFLIILTGVFAVLGWPIQFLWGVVVGVVLFHASIGFTGAWHDYRGEE